MVIGQSKMEFDIVVLGATGFTGRLVVEYLTQVTRQNVTWLITGRSKDKLGELVAGLKVKGVDISHIPTQIADVNDKESLSNVVRRAEVVVNCVGPNTILSESVVEACIHSGTHYVDMSGEINHILNLYVKYHKVAEEANVLIVPSCGYACLAPVSGLLYLKEQFQGTLHSVECYLEIDVPKRAYIPFYGSLASYGTWDSAVHVMRNHKQYKRLKEETFPTADLPKEMKRNFFHWRRRTLWHPYIGPEEVVIEMSEKYLQEKRNKRPAHCKIYTKMPLCIHYLFVPWLILYFHLSYFNWFANLLRRFPRLFTLGYMSHEGPSEKMREDTKYSVSYIGKGWDRSVEDFSKPPSKKVKVKMSSKDPYGSTAILIIVAAITILKERSQMPSGGVVNVGAAFCETSLIKSLSNNGINYEVIPNT